MEMWPARLMILAVIGLALSSCEPPDRDIIVANRNGELVVDFPWSIWRLLGRQDRTYCISRVELFDGKELLWTLAAQGDVQCVDVTMPLKIGASKAGFASKGGPSLRRGITYGIGIDGIGAGRVDFTLGDDDRPKNERHWDKQIKGPCGSYFGVCPPHQH